MIDIDGTLLAGSTPLPAMNSFLSFLQSNGIPFLILTNNSTLSPQAYIQKMREHGVILGEKNILTCSTVAANYMHSNLDGHAVYVIGESGLEEALLAEGYHLISDVSKPVDFVVVGGDHYLTYDKLKYGCLHLQTGAHFIGTNPDVVSPSEEGLIPECGTNIAALEAASGRKATVIGKPNPLMFLRGLEVLGSQPSETIMLGDRLETDIIGGQQAGLKTILIETGVDKQESITDKGITPDLVVKNLAVLLDLWKNAISP